MSSVLEIIVNGKDNATGVLRSVGGALGNLGDSATSAGMKLLPLSAGAAVVAGSALTMAANYEQSMNVLQASTGASATEMAALGKLAVDLGGDMTLPATSAKDAADAMLELSKAGLSVNDTMAAAKGVLQLSAAAQIGNAEAALTTANALNMFKLSGDQATAVADLLAAGANKSSANIREMADALQMSGNVAANAGLSIGDVTTAIALMANQGIKGSDAGTSLKQMLLSLQAPSKNAASIMKELGISIYDANGSMLPMPELIDQFSGALGGLTEKQRNAALATIFGSDAVRSANVLLMGGTAAWQDMSAAVSQGGEAAAMAAAQNKGLGGAIDGLRSVIETTLLTAAGPLLESLSGMVRWVGELVGRFAEAHPEITTAGVAFAGVLAVAAPLALGIGVISTALGALLAPVGAVVLAVAGLAAAWTTDFGGIRTTVQDTASNLIERFGWIKDAVLDAGWQSSEAWEAMSTLIGERGATLVQTLLAKVGEFKTVWTDTWSRVQEVVDRATAAIQRIIETVLGAVREFLDAHGEEIALTLGNAWGQISEIVNLAVQVIQETIVPALEAIARFIAAHKTEIVAILDAAWTVIKTIIETVLGTIKGILTAVLALIRGDWSGAWEAIQGVTETVWQGIKTLIITALNLIDTLTGGALTRIANWFTTTWTGIQTATTTAFNAIQTTIEAVWNGITGFFETVLFAVETLFRLAWKVIDELTGGALKRMQTQITAVWEGIKTFIATALTAIQTTFETIWNAITEFFGNKLATTQTKTETVWNAISSFLTTILGAIQTLFETVWNAISSFLTTIFAAIQTLFETVWTAIRTYVYGDQMTLKDLLTTIWNAIKTFITTTLTAIQTTFETIWTAIKTFIATTLAAMQATVETIWTAIQTYLATTLAAIQTTFESIWNAMLAFVRQVWENMRAAIVDKLNAIASALGSISFPNPFAVVEGWIDSARAAIDRFLSWLNGLKIPNPFDGLFNLGGQSGMSVDAALVGGRLAGNSATGVRGGNVSNRGGDTYNITVNTNATSGTYLADLQMARALAW
jgi:TP901 family phage tail tape measure protein